VVSVTRALAVVPTEKQLSRLRVWSHGGSTPYRLVIRSRIVLLASQGRSNREIARTLHTTPITVARWRSRFILFGTEGIRTDAPRVGSPPPIADEVARRILQKTLHERPRGRQRWSTRSLARETGVSHTTVRLIWKRHGIRPDRSWATLLARDPLFGPKKVDLVGVYHNPPRRAVALSFGDARTASKSARRPPAETARSTERVESRWMSDLLATLTSLEGHHLVSTTQRYREQELLSFLQSIHERRNGSVKVVLQTEPDGPTLSPSLIQWLRRHPRVSHEVANGSESWKQKVVTSIWEASEGRTQKPAPSGLPNLVNAVARWERDGADHPGPFAWIDDRSLGLRRSSRTSE